MCCEHAFERRVVRLERGERLVQPVADLVVEVVADVLPAACGRDEERVAVVVGIVGSSLGVLLAAALGELVGDDLLPLDLEHVARPLQEQHAEDVLLELGGIHLPAQDVGGGEEVPFELRKGQHGTKSRPSRRDAG